MTRPHSTMLEPAVGITTTINTAAVLPLPPSHRLRCRPSCRTTAPSRPGRPTTPNAWRRWPYPRPRPERNWPCSGHSTSIGDKRLSPCRICEVRSSIAPERSWLRHLGRWFDCARSWRRHGTKQIPARQHYQRKIRLYEMRSAIYRPRWRNEPLAVVTVPAWGRRRLCPLIPIS